jgi:hypothetical protein
MTALLEKAFQEVSKLPQDEQDALARWILEVVYANHRWDEILAVSADTLAALADEALGEYRVNQEPPISDGR